MSAPPTTVTLEEFQAAASEAGLLSGFLWSTVPGLLPGLVLLLIAWAVGRRRERAHFRRLEAGERELRGVRALSVGPEDLAVDMLGAALVTGGVVVGSDLFKRWRAGVRGLFGGRIPHYETMMERARREAVLRLKRDALARGSRLVLGVRVETSTIGGEGGRGGGAAVEVFAFGTAVGATDAAAGAELSNS